MTVPPLAHVRVLGHIGLVAIMISTGSLDNEVSPHGNWHGFSKPRFAGDLNRDLDLTDDWPGADLPLRRVAGKDAAAESSIIELVGQRGNGAAALPRKGSARTSTTASNYQHTERCTRASNGRASQTWHWSPHMFVGDGSEHRRKGCDTPYTQFQTRCVCQLALNKPVAHTDKECTHLHCCSARCRVQTFHKCLGP